MSTKKNLEAALAEAEAGLSHAISNAARLGAGHRHSHEPNVEIDKARAFCRQARAALNQYLRSQP